MSTFPHHLPNYLLATLCLLLFAMPNYAQEPENAELPLVFQIGTREEQHMVVDSLINRNLFDATDYEIDDAREVWGAFLESMEAYAEEIDYPLGGMEVWLRVYLAPTGKIMHLGFLLAEDSRYVPDVELRAFFSSFARNRAFPLTYAQPFKHNAKVRFPLHSGTD